MAFECACHVYVDARSGRLSYRLVLEPFEEADEPGPTDQAEKTG